MAMAEYIEILRQLPLFNELDDDDLGKIAATVNEFNADEGEVIIREGDKGDTLFVLVAGEVQIIKHYLEPGSTVVAVITPVNTFGEMALLDFEERSATVLTSEPCRFLIMDRISFRDVLIANPDICYHLLVDSYRRLRQANELISAYQTD